jgi:hypothetical protein
MGSGGTILLFHRERKFFGGKETTFFPAPQWEPGKKVILTFPPKGCLQLIKLRFKKKSIYHPICVATEKVTVVSMLS